MPRDPQRTQGDQQVDGHAESLNVGPRQLYSAIMRAKIRGKSDVRIASEIDGVSTSVGNLGTCRDVPNQDSKVAARCDVEMASHAPRYLRRRTLSAA